MIRSLRFSPFFLLLMLWLSGPRIAQAQSGCSFTLDPLSPPYACLGGVYEVRFSAPCLTGPFRVEISQCAPPFYNFQPADTSYIIDGNPATVRIPKNRDTNCIRGIRVIHIASGAASNVKTIQYLPVDKGPKPQSAISIVSPIKPLYCPTDSILFKIDTIILSNANPPPTFQWLKNGTPVPGAVRATFVYAQWKPGDCIRLLVTKGNQCAVNDTGSSPSICLNIAKKPRATLVIAGNGSGCADSNTTFRLDTADVGQAATFKWFINDVPVPGQTGITFAYTAGLANCGDKIMGRVYTQSCPDSATGGPVPLKGCGKVRVGNVIPPTSCAGDSLHIDYTTLACFNADNVFTFELSDQNGSYANPTILGTVADSNGGTFHTVSPEGLQGGFNFHIRISSSSPAGISLNESDTLEIYTRPGSPFPQNAQRCGPGRLTLGVNVVGAVSYAWYTTQRGFGDVRVRYPGPGGAPGGGALVTTDTFSIFLTKDTAFYVVAISAFGCESRIRSTVRGTINPPLVVSAGPDQQACEGGSCIPLTGASPGPGTWSGAGVVGSTFCPGILAPGNYTVQYKYVSSEGCSDSATKSITINAIPAPDAGIQDSSVCVPGPPFRFSLHGATPGGGIWSGSAALLDNQGTYNPSLMPAGNDTIYYTIVLAGCSRSDFRVLHPVHSPVFDVNVTNASACLTPDGSATVSPFDGATQTATFFSVTNPGPVPSTGPTATGLAPGRYTVVVSQAGITCETELSFVVDDPDGPVPDIQGLNPAYCSSDVPVILTSSVPGGRWLSSPSNLINTLTGEFNPSNAPTGPISIYYTIRDAISGCLGADTATTTINQSPGVEPEADTTLCQNSPAIRLSPGGVWSGPGVAQDGAGYFFTPNDNGAGLVNILTKTATANGCATTVSRTILVNPIPVISLTPTGTITVCEGGTATVSATLSVSVPGAFYTLFNSNTGLPLASNNTGIFQVGDSGTYRIMVATGPCGDTSSASVRVDIITLPAVSAGADTLICRNSGLFALVGTPSGAPFTTHWSGNNVAGDQFDPSTAAAQTQVRYVIQFGACLDSASRLIQVTDPLVASLSASQTSTCNTPVTLTAAPSGGSFSYFFYKDGILVSSPGGSPSPVYTVTSTGSYQVSVIPQSSGGIPACGDTSASITITIDSLPPTDSLLTLVNLSACRNDASISLDAAPAPYTTTWSGEGVIPIGPNVYFFNPQAAGSGVHRLRVTLSNGSCSRNDSILAGVGSTPIFSVKHQDATSCVSNDGTATIVYGSAGSNYFVSIFPIEGAIVRNGDSTTITGLPQGQYSVTVANPTSLCDTTVTFRINNPTTFRARITGVDTAYCINDNPIIAQGAPSGTRPFPFLLEPTGPSEGHYTNPAVIDPASLTPGLYTLTYEQDSGGCLAVDSIRFRIRPLPVADIVQDTVTVCAGSPGIFNATVVPGGRYIWRFGPDSIGSGSSISVSNPGGYSLTVISGSCTSNTVFGFLRALPAPEASINVVGNDTACIGSSVTLSAGGSGSPTWSGPGGPIGSTPTIQGTVSGTYTLILSNGVCADTATQALTFTPRPSARVTASGNLTFCENDSVTLTAAAQPANVRFIWTNLAGDSLTDGPSIVIRDARTVILRVIDLTTGCDSTSGQFTTAVQPRPLRGIQILGDVNFCAGGFVDLNAVEPSGTYEWHSIPATTPVEGQTTRGVRVTQSGQYYVIINPTGCLDTSDIVTVTVDTVPTARILDVTSPLSLCQGSTFVLHAQQGTGNTYQWQIGGVDQTDSTRSTFTLPTNTPNTYTVTLVVRAPGGGCAQTSQPINVTVNPTPQATIFALTDTVVCPGTNVILGGNNTPGTVPQWLRGADNVSPVPPSNFLTTNIAGEYRFVLVQGSCSDTSRSIKVKVINLGTVVAGDDKTVCISDPIFSLTGYSPALGPNTAFSGPGIVAGTDQFNPLVAGQGCKDIIYTYSDSGCSVRDTVQICVVPGFSVAIAPSSTTICAQTQTTLTTTITPRVAGLTYTYQWFRNGRQIDGATDSTLITSKDSTYTVIVSGGTCSSLSLPALITFRAFTPVSLGPDISLCRSQGTYRIVPTGLNNGTFSGTDVDPATGVINLVTASGGEHEIIYTTDQDGCIIRDTVLITINDNPIAEAKFTNLTTGVEGQALDIGDQAKLVATAGGTTYTWDPAVGAGQAPNEAIVAPTVTTNYTVTISSTSGCISTGSVTVVVRTDVRVANAFSPNGDGQNDTWNIYNISAYGNADIRVYNRWGALVYEAKGSEYTNKPWDGTSKGDKLPVGAYYYTVDLNNNTKPFIGDVSLVR